jgi:biopolymer transport protein ExbD
MLAAPLASEQAVPVNLPSESASEQTQVDKNTKFVSFSMDAQRNIYLDNVRIDLRDAAVRLRTLDAKNTVIRIRADAKVSYQELMSMVDEVKKAGLVRFQFDTQASR